MVSISKQLTDIYYKHEDWHIVRMSYKDALRYHEKRLNDGEIQVYVESGEVLGYYQRHFVYNVCFLDNIWIKKECRRGKVFKELCKQFWSTLPENITYIFGEDKGTTVHKVKISSWRK